MILFGGKFSFSLYATGIYVARNFGGCPACASSTDVSVRKCHRILQGRGRLRVTDSQRLPLCEETLLIRLHHVHSVYIFLFVCEFVSKTTEPTGVFSCNLCRVSCPNAGARTEHIV